MLELNWPAVALVLGLSSILLFKNPISRLLERTRKVGKLGLETFDAPRLPAPADKPNPLAEFMATYDNPVLRTQEASIVADLKTRGLTDPDAAQTALVRSLAGFQILLLFERVQSAVWASQVAALTYLNSTGPVPVGQLRPFYNEASNRYPDLYSQYSFDSWVAFLRSWLLIDVQENTVLLTAVGVEFLKWRIDDRRAGPFHG